MIPKGAADEEICKLEKKASKVGLDVSTYLIKMKVMMTSEGIESMQVLFEMYKSLLQCWRCRKSHHTRRIDIGKCQQSRQAWAK